MFRLPFVLIAVAVAALSGGSRQAQTIPASVYAIRDAPAGLRPPMQRGDLIIIGVQSALLSELSRELDRGGPAGAIRACHLDATEAAFQAARKEGIAVGRTSARLRNPLNAAPPWAAETVARYSDSRAADVEGFVADLGDRIGMLRPIAHRSMCTPCHGVDAKLDPRVREELKDRYPVDRAVNFTDGDLRGWYWIEVPKRSS